MRRCVYCGDPGQLVIGPGVVACPSHRDVALRDPMYAVRSPHGVTTATRPEARPAQDAPIARNDRVGDDDAAA